MSSKLQGRSRLAIGSFVTPRREESSLGDGFSRRERSFSVPRLRSDTAAQPESRRNDSGDRP
ncbi:hypothetical protein [Microcoleus sp. S13_B4]|uniref:hypothetical protein n=1 Tax=Microcoleus sp. S13_B4 TaxID=3055408 RepID=UPI002FD1F126